MDQDEDEEDFDEEEEDSDEDLDHDELILGNTTDVIISLAKALGNQMIPFLQMLAPPLVEYLNEDHPRSDHTMVVGCLAEVFNVCPAAIPAMFEDYMNVLMKMCGTEDGGLNRNVAYGIGVLAKRSPLELFGNHTGTALTMTKTMWQNSEE
jgi:hypothetical protein